MKRYLTALAALLVLPLTPASAQDVPTTPAAAALRIYNWCLTLPAGSVSECSCVAGYYAAATSDDEFQILSVAAAFFTPEGTVSDEDGVRTAIFGMRDQLGLSEEEFAAIMERFVTFDEIGDAADGICLAVEEQASADEADE